MGDFVYNLIGTSGRKCRCRTRPNTWLAHWERGTGLPLPEKCCAKYCRRYVEVGAHVRHHGSDGRIPWIVPFCQHHNKRPPSHAIELKNGVTLCGAAMNIDCD